MRSANRASQRRAETAILADEPVKADDLDAAYDAVRRFTLIRPWVYNLVIALGVIALTASFTNLPWSLVAGPVLCAFGVISANRGKNRYRRAVEWADKYLSDGDGSVE